MVPVCRWRKVVGRVRNSRRCRSSEARIIHAKGVIRLVIIRPAHSFCSNLAAAAKAYNSRVEQLRAPAREGKRLWSECGVCQSNNAPLETSRSRGTRSPHQGNHSMPRNKSKAAWMCRCRACVTPALLRPPPQWCCPPMLTMMLMASAGNPFVGCCCCDENSSTNPSTQRHQHQHPHPHHHKHLQQHQHTCQHQHLI